MMMVPSRRELFVMLGLLVVGCRRSQVPVEQKHQNEPASATVTLIVDGMI
jgi:hypothetical protein